MSIESQLYYIQNGEKFQVQFDATYNAESTFRNLTVGRFPSRFYLKGINIPEDSNLQQHCTETHMSHAEVATVLLSPVGPVLKSITNRPQLFSLY